MDNKYHINVIIPSSVINLFKENLKEAIEDGFKEDAEDYKMILDRLYELQKNDAEVSTLEEYFSLIKELEDITHEDVLVWGGGKFLQLLIDK